MSTFNTTNKNELAPVYYAGIGTSYWIAGIVEQKPTAEIPISYCKPSDYRAETPQRQIPRSKPQAAIIYDDHGWGE